MPPQHQRRAIEWWLYDHAIAPTPRAALTRPAHQQIIDSPDPHDHIGPDLYGTGLTAEEGLWTRRGWAGRP